jgi:glycosyltransferase involved in cell wall biosynthesis
VQGIVSNSSNNTKEIIVVFDGCNDNSESIVRSILDNVSDKTIKYAHAPNVFETKANNIGLKLVECDYVTIIQDDMIVVEKDFDQRLIKPFMEFDDVFAVTSFVAHNSVYNESTKELNYIDIANKHNCNRETFYAREYANRGPLMYNYEDVVKLNFLDEYFSPQNYDDMDISMRALKELGKVSGLYLIDYISDLNWGTTRRAPNSILNNIHITNAAKIMEKHADLVMSSNRVVDNRKLQ